MFYDWVVSIHFNTYDQKIVTAVFETPSHWMLKILGLHDTKENIELLFPDLFSQACPFLLENMHTPLPRFPCIRSGMIKEFTPLFPSDFKSVFVWHLTDKILSFEFYPKAVFFECNFRISLSAIVHLQNWPIGLQLVGSRIRWRQRLVKIET